MRFIFLYFKSIWLLDGRKTNRGTKVKERPRGAIVGKQQECALRNSWVWRTFWRRQSEVEGRGQTDGSSALSTHGKRPVDDGASAETGAWQVGVSGEPGPEALR